MIAVEDLSKRFGGIHAVDGVSLSIERGTITGLIGPNGAGKTTLFNIIAGVFPPSSGRVRLDGEDVTGLEPHALFHKGLLRTFQIAHEFSSLTVLENLMVVPGGQPGEQLRHAWFNDSRVRETERRIKERAHEVTEFLQIAHLENELAGNLSGGQKKLLELGRTMMVDAKVVLLDEVGAGVNRTLLNTIASSIERSLSLTVPLIAVIIGEGMSGGAIALAAGNNVLMLEHAIYSVISPEGCSSILWRSSDNAEEAAAAMKLTAQELLSLKIIDEIIPEPMGGAHREPVQTIHQAGEEIRKTLAKLEKLSPAELKQGRREKFLAMGRQGLH